MRPDADSAHPQGLTHRPFTASRVPGWGSAPARVHAVRR